MAILYSNNAYATLAAGINSSATALTVASGLGARFPAISGSDFFYVTLVDSVGNLEIVKVTARSTDVFTIVRAQDSTAAQAFSLGDGVQLRIIKAMLDVFPQTGGPLGSPSTVGTMPAFTLGGTVAGGGNQINNVIIGNSSQLAGSFTTLSASGTSNLVATNIIGTATIGGNSATPTLYLGGPAPDADRGANIYFQSSSVQKNWRVSHDGYVADSLEFTPSTVGGGSTYTTPAVVMSPTGLAVTGTLSATGNITRTSGAISTTLASDGIYAVGTDLYLLSPATFSTFIYANNVSIGTFSSTGLAVTGALSATGMISKGTTTGAPSTGDDLVLQTTGYTGITLFGGAADASTVYFRNQAAPTVERGYLQYDFATSLMTSGSNTAVTGTLSATGTITSTSGNNTTVFTAASATTGYLLANLINGGGSTYIATTANTGGLGIIGGGAYASTFGSTTNTNIELITNNTVRQIINGDGNVGIGVTPSAWNSSYKFAQFYDATSAFVGGSGYAAQLGANAYINSGSVWVYGGGSYKASRYEQFNGEHLWFRSTSTPVINTDAVFTQAMTLTAAGSLIVGDTTGNGTISARNASAALIEVKTTAGTNYAAVEVINGSGGVYLGKDNSAGNFFGSNTAYSACIYSYGAHPLVFFTSGTERARIDSSGNLLVGTTSALNGTARLDVSAPSGNNVSATLKNDAGAGQWNTQIWNAGTTGDNAFIQFATETSYTGRGSITYNRAGGLVAYNVTSDYRAKDISGPVTGSGALIDSIPVYMGKMKDATQERPMFIAHETPIYAHTGEKDAVDKDGKPVYQQMDASALIPVMWAELQSLRARVAQLESKP